MPRGRKAKGKELPAEAGVEATAVTKILPVRIEEEMKSSYINYAMSVIVGRALPDIRDGLKPVHRRILFGMHELGLPPGKPHKKSARIVGEVLGKYHPHGDMAVYDSLVRMAQDFSLRYLLIDGQGNFGSVDGDAPAAMRYTEVRLNQLATEMLADLEKETVDFAPNFDESLTEPSVLPSKIPNLLINGSSGIAVGMATNIPPQNLAETVDGIVHVIEDPEASVDQLMEDIKGPDFPTGALICGTQGIKDAYRSGRGLLTLRARVDFEELKSGKTAIIVKEIPYQVNKAQLVEQIANLVKDKKVVGIVDLRDESDRTGMRVYIELRREANRELVLNQLFKHTDMQVTFGVNMVALVEGEPRLLTLKDLIVEYIRHRETVVTRRTQFELKRAEEQAHILEGLRICLANLDAVIKLIRGSKTVEEARQGLIEKFKLSEKQAQAILDMRLQRLTALEREKIEEEYNNLVKLIAELKAILTSKKKILGIIKTELLEIKRKYGDMRRTEITHPVEEMAAEDLIPDLAVAVIMTRDGFIKRMPINLFRAQLRGGRGVSGMTTREEDAIDNIFTTTNLSNLLFFTNQGKVYRLKAYEIPEAGRAAKGQSIANVLQLGQGENVTAAISLKEKDSKQFLMMATEQGNIKKTELTAFENIRRTGIIAISLKEGDSLNWVRLTDGKEEIMLSTQNGMLIRFAEKDVRSMGRTAAGVRGIRAKKGDKVVSMDMVEEGGELLLITASGFGKRTDLSEIHPQHRGGQGHIIVKTRENDRMVRARVVHPEDEILVVTAGGTISRQKVAGISNQGRYAKGVRVQRVEEGDYVVDLARMVAATESDEEKA